MLSVNRQGNCPGEVSVFIEMKVWWWGWTPYDPCNKLQYRENLQIANMHGCQGGKAMTQFHYLSLTLIWSEVEEWWSLVSVKICHWVSLPLWRRGRRVGDILVGTQSIWPYFNHTMSTWTEMLLNQITCPKVSRSTKHVVCLESRSCSLENWFPNLCVC